MSDVACSGSLQALRLSCWRGIILGFKESKCSIIGKDPGFGHTGMRFWSVLKNWREYTDYFAISMGHGQGAVHGTFCVTVLEQEDRRHRLFLAWNRSMILLRLAYSRHTGHRSPRFTLFRVCNRTDMMVTSIFVVEFTTRGGNWRATGLPMALNSIKHSAIRAR